MNEKTRYVFYCRFCSLTLTSPSRLRDHELAAHADKKKAVEAKFGAVRARNDMWPYIDEVLYSYGADEFGKGE